MLLKKVALIISSLFDKFKRDNFWAPFLKASEVTPKNGGGEGSISILVGNSYNVGFHTLDSLAAIVFIAAYITWNISNVL